MISSDIRNILRRRNRHIKAKTRFYTILLNIDLRGGKRRGGGSLVLSALIKNKRGKSEGKKNEKMFYLRKRSTVRRNH